MAYNSEQGGAVPTQHYCAINRAVQETLNPWNKKGKKDNILWNSYAWSMNYYTGKTVGSQIAPSYSSVTEKLSDPPT